MRKGKLKFRQNGQRSDGKQNYYDDLTMRWSCELVRSQTTNHGLKIVVEIFNTSTLIKTIKDRFFKRS